MKKTIFITSDGDALDLGTYIGDAEKARVSREIEGTALKCSLDYNIHIFQKEQPKYPWAQGLYNDLMMYAIGPGLLIAFAGYMGIVGYSQYQEGLAPFPLVEFAAAIVGIVILAIAVMARDNSDYEQLEIGSFEHIRSYRKETKEIDLIFGRVADVDGQTIIIEPATDEEFSRIQDSMDLFYPLYSIIQEIGRRIAIYIPISKTLSEEEVRVYTDKIMQKKFEAHNAEICDFIHTLFFDNKGQLLDENREPIR